MTERCPNCDVELTLTLAPPTEPTRAERIAMLNELDPEARGRAWAQEEDRRTLAQLEAERGR